MNFFSRINKRDIQIEGKNFSLKADLIKNYIEIFWKQKEKKYSWKKYKFLILMLKNIKKF